MRNIINIQTTARTQAKTNFNLPVRSIDLFKNNEAIDSLMTEGGKDFYDYFNRIGLATDPNLIVLSSIYSYYYEDGEMNNARIVINLKELNRIKQVRNFLHAHLHFMSPKCNFLGCFVNNTRVNRYSLRKSSSLLVNKKRSDDIENSIVSRFPFINMLYELMDSKTNTYMTESSVTSLLKDNNFKVIDMTEFNGLTYFHSQKLGHTYN